MPSGGGVKRNTLSGGLRVQARKFPGKVIKALNLEMGISRKEVVKITPLDQGDLRRTIKVVKAMQVGTHIIGGITAGDDSTEPYDIVQHEDLTLNHQEPGTGAKYLEKIIHADRDTIRARVMRRLLDMENE